MIFETNHSNYKIKDNHDEPLINFKLEDFEKRTSHVYYDHDYWKYTGYKGVVYTPLDIPKLDIDVDLLWQLWQKHIGVVDIYEGNKQFRVADPWFDDKTEYYPKQDMYSSGMEYRNFHLIKNHNFSGYNHIGDEWYPWVTENFPQIIEHLELLPFDNIRWCCFVGRDTHGVHPHYDDYHDIIPKMKDYDPAAIRIRFSKVDWKNEHFYLTNTHGRKRLYPQLPPETNTFCYDATTNEHGGDRGFKPDYRCQLMPYGVLNKDKYFELLERSIHKYKDYVITMDHMNMML